MKSAGNEGVAQSSLQMLHIHVLLVAPLGARNVAKSGADQHQGRVAVRERPHHTRPAADLSVQPLDYIVCADARPVLATSSQCFPQLVSLARSLCASVTVRTINIWAGQTVKGIYRCCQALTADISSNSPPDAADIDLKFITLNSFCQLMVCTEGEEHEQNFAWAAARLRL